MKIYLILEINQTDRYVGMFPIADDDIACRLFTGSSAFQTRSFYYNTLHYNEQTISYYI